jgi:glutamate-ammonia-ligase adenylyltransferase
MHVEQLRHSLESCEAARPLLSAWEVRDFEHAWRDLVDLAETVGFDGLVQLCGALPRLLPRCADPDMALRNLERFLARQPGREQVSALVEARARTLEVLLQILSASQFLSDVLVANPDYLGMLRVPLRRSPNRRELREQLQAEVTQAGTDAAVLGCFRSFRQRQFLRIGSNDIIRERSLEEITRDISRVAEAAVDVALEVALGNIQDRYGQPFTKAGQPARCAVFAFGKLGGEELNYSSDIDLMFVYDEEGGTKGRRVTNIANSEFYSRVVGEVIRLLSVHTDHGQAYRVDLRLRPEGQRGPLARSLPSTLSYYDALGRTWERQALIKLRTVAGDRKLGDEFLQAIEGFVYRKYLSFSEINEIKAIKRRIEQKSASGGGSDTDVKTGHGGIRDIEFTIQFLQLLNGGDLPDLRQRNTLLAMKALEQAGCLSDQEFQILDKTYRFLRKTEHRLQLLFDLQTHRLPEGTEELRKLALRMGYLETAERQDPLVSADSQALAAFLNDYRENTDLNRKILDHLLHDTFQGEDGRAEPESDLILDTAPEPETIRAVLGRYPFRDVQTAYHNLSQLGQEGVPFLSTRRCRHFLANIAPHLLRALAETPDPDMALMNLEKVTASLGAKAVLWELFSFNTPSLKLYVDLCAWSQFLSEILINNPGMIDELLDSLVLNQPRTGAELRQELTDLCRGSSEPEPILHSFQDKELLRIGVRDILGKDTIQSTTSSLSDLAEAIFAQIAVNQEPALEKRFGTPYLSEGARAGQPSRYVILGLGKLGGREMGYHSDLDLILIYEGDGQTGPSAGASRFDTTERTDNFHFFTEFTQRIIRVASYLGPLGRLYHVDMRLRPTGQSGSLVLPLPQFERYYEPEGGAQVWERLALTKARVVHGSAEFALEVMKAVESAAYGQQWRPGYADEIRSMRDRLEASRGNRNLKRGFGGIVDVEFLAQLLLIKYGNAKAGARSTNTWEALRALHNAGLLDRAQFEVLENGYSLLRQIESRLRIVHNISIDELPDDPEDLERLARRLDRAWTQPSKAAPGLLERLESCTKQIRDVYLQIIARERESQD